MTMPKQPNDCTGLADIRVGIDHIDRQIVNLLEQRMGYVKAAAHFKPSEESIPAPDRVADMLEERQKWAIDAGLPPDGISAIFEQLISWYIKQQVLHWRTLRG